MPLELFDLGELQVKSKTSNQSLYLACSITLDFPDIIDRRIDPVALAEMTKSGRLWISKADTCRLEVAASVQGVEASGCALTEYVIDGVAVCHIWEDMTLKLRREAPKIADDDAKQVGYTSFVINHPNLSSDFLSPKDIPCANLLSITCDICYGSRPRKKKAARRPAKKRKIQEEEPERPRAQGLYGLQQKPKRARIFDRPETDEDEDEEDRDQTQRRKSRPSLTPHPQPEPNSGAQNTQQSQQPTTTEPEPEVIRADIASLIKAGLTKLLGIKRFTPGARLAKDLPSPTLVDIAPAVFNIRFLQAFASRAEHIPWLASCLSGLNAESPSLRAKIRALAEEDHDGEVVLVDAAAQLEKRLHVLVQRGLDVAPLPHSRKGKPKVSVPVDDDTQQPEELSQQAEDSTQYPELEFSQQVDLSQERELALADEMWQQRDLSQRAQHALEQNNWEPWSQNAVMEDSQHQATHPEDEPPNSWHHSQQQQFEPPEENEPQHSWHYSQQPGHEWLDLSQASFVLDENLQPVPTAFENLDDEDYEYRVVALAEQESFVKDENVQPVPMGFAGLDDEEYVYQGVPLAEQARFVLDENGQPVPMDFGDVVYGAYEEYELMLVPLGEG